LSYLQKSLSILTEKNTNNTANVALVYSNLGLIYGKLQQYNKALSYHQKALKIKHTCYNKPHADLASENENIAWCYLHTENYVQALQYYHKALHIREKLYGFVHVDEAHSYQNIGNCYRMQQQYDTAIKNLQLGLNVCFALNNPVQHRTVQICTDIGRVYQEKKAYEKAIIYFQKALSLVFPQLDKNAWEHNPVVKGFTGQIIDILYPLKHKAHALLQWYYHTNNKKQAQQFLYTAFNTYQLCITLIDQLRLNYSSEMSQIDFMEHTAISVFEQAIETATALYEVSGNTNYAEQCWEWMEKSKALTLLTQLRDTQARNAANIPNTCLQEARNLQVELSYVRKQLQQLSTTLNNESPKIRQLHQQYFDLEEAHRQLVQQIEQQYPAYYNLKYNTKVSTINTVQALLPPHTALVEYFITNTQLYCFVINKNKYHLYKISVHELPKQLANLAKAIKQLRRKTYIKQATQLYKTIISPIQAVLQQVKHLLIVPAGELFYLPFEALLHPSANNNLKYNQLPYLIQQYSISYHYSATLFVNRLQVSSQQQTPSFLGFAPVYTQESSNDDTNFIITSAYNAPNLQYHRPHLQRSFVYNNVHFKSLKHSKTEVNNIVEQFESEKLPATAYLYQEANVQHFKQRLKGYKYLLIAAHTHINHQHPDLSGIIFSPSGGQQANSQDVLHVADTYHLQLDADLVVLSCCESGVGNLLRSEGMIALNRGFIYSGVPNIIFTLFKVYDQASSILIQNLFAHVLSNDTYTIALQKAKCALIQHAKITPKSWAAFVLIGY